VVAPTLRRGRREEAGARWVWRLEVDKAGGHLACQIAWVAMRLET
jgi:hypothetical protein